MAAAEGPNARRYNDAVSELPQFFGNSKDTMSAQTMIDRVETARLALGWEQKETFNFFRVALQDNAQDWITMTKNLDPAYTESWTWISKEFKIYYGETIDESKIYLICKQLAMKPDENVRDYMIRFSKLWTEISDMVPAGAIVVPADEAERTVDYCTTLYAQGARNREMGIQKLFFVAGLPHKILTKVVQKNIPTTMEAYKEAVKVANWQETPAKKNGGNGIAAAAETQEEEETDEQFVNQIRNGSGPNRGAPYGASRGFNGRGRSLSRGRGGPANRGSGRGGSAGPSSHFQNGNGGENGNGNGNGNYNSFEPKPKCKFCSKEGHNQEKCFKRINANAPCINKNGAKYWPNTNRQQAPIPEGKEGEENQQGAVYNRSENLFQ